MATRLHSSIHHGMLRSLHEANCEVTASNFMYPVFVVCDDDAVEPIAELPALARFGIKRLIEHLQPLVTKGLMSVLLFGVIDSSRKDERATNADSACNPVVRALPILRKTYPHLLIACDVCLCPYTRHGHCGILDEHGIRNAESIERLAEIALTYGKAGAHIVAPSDMMDNRVKAIKDKLLSADLENRVSVLSYAAKFASCFYGPFRDAMHSSPAFGDRSKYQLPSGAPGLAMRAVQRDISEGADMVIVKPALPYLDIVRQIKDNYKDHPVFVYQVSGEYAMMWHASQNNVFNLKQALGEVIKSFRRAGADCIITYFTPTILEMIAENK